MNKERIQQIIQYILLLASHEDDYNERKLGPIHFIKYVYLADMEHAKYNHGRTYTGIRWQFYKLGPWSQEVHEEIEPSLKKINAIKEEIPSTYCDDDYVRWALAHDSEPHSVNIQYEFDLTVKSALKNYVHKFKNNTSALLHFVYATLPILSAAPGEYLDFSVMKKEKTVIQQNSETEFVPFLERISKRRRNTLTSKMEELKKSFQEKFKKKKFEYKSPSNRYDAVFEKGVEWLDSLAGENLPEDGTTALIDESVWKSDARRGNEK